MPNIQIKYTTMAGVDKALIGSIIESVCKTVQKEVPDEDMAFGLCGALVGTILTASGSTLDSIQDVPPVAGLVEADDE